MKNTPDLALENGENKTKINGNLESNNGNLDSLKALAETFTLTAFFRSLVNYPYSKEAIDYLLAKSGLSKEELQARWDGFDKVFGEEHGKVISALSFSTIIEARGLLLDEILIKEVDKNTIVLEMASGFSPRALNLINNKGFNPNQYIETDRQETIGLKHGFYDTLNDTKKPLLVEFNVVNDDISKIIELISGMKELYSDLNKLVITLEGLLIYLKPEEQKSFFDKLRLLSNDLGKLGIDVKFLSIDMPTHENFTDWLLHEGFTHDEHVQVMKNVDPVILECLHKTENDFLENNGIDINKVKKDSYISSSGRGDKVLLGKRDLKLMTGKLDKYKNIPGINEKIEEFLGQYILFAYLVDLSNH